MAIAVRFLGKRTLQQGLGSFRQGAVLPVVFGHCVDLKRAVEQGGAEVINGEPTENEEVHDPSAGALKFQPLTLEGIKTGLHRADIERAALTLMLNGTSKDFSKVSPADQIAEPLLLRENESVAAARATEEKALAWLQAWPAMRAQEKRAAALAALAEADLETVAAQDVASAPVVEADDLSARKHVMLAVRALGEMSASGLHSATALEAIGAMLTDAQHASAHGQCARAVELAGKVCDACRTPSVTGASGGGG